MTTKTYFVVETRTGSSSFENIWTDFDRNTGKETPTTFETFHEALTALNMFIGDTVDAALEGHLTESYDPEDYQITEQDDTTYGD